MAIDEDEPDAWADSAVGETTEGDERREHGRAAKPGRVPEEGPVSARMSGGPVDPPAVSAEEHGASTTLARARTEPPPGESDEA